MTEYKKRCTPLNLVIKVKKNTPAPAKGSTNIPTILQKFPVVKCTGYSL